jgi:hypothetical protein
MAAVFVDRPKSSDAKADTSHFVIVLAGGQEIGNFKTQEAAKDRACADGYRPVHVARVRHLQDRVKPDHSDIPLLLVIPFEVPFMLRGVLASTPLPGGLVPDPPGAALGLPADCANAGVEIAMAATATSVRIDFICFLLGPTELAQNASGVPQFQPTRRRSGLSATSIVRRSAAGGSCTPISERLARRARHRRSARPAPAALHTSRISGARQHLEAASATHRPRRGSGRATPHASRTSIAQRSTGRPTRQRRTTMALRSGTGRVAGSGGARRVISRRRAASARSRSVCGLAAGGGSPGSVSV